MGRPLRSDGIDAGENDFLAIERGKANRPVLLAGSCYTERLAIVAAVNETRIPRLESIGRGLERPQRLFHRPGMSVVAVGRDVDFSRRRGGL